MPPFRYVGLSSSGITYKASSASFSSSRSGLQSSERYGGFGNKSDGDSFKDSYNEKYRYDEDKVDQSTFKPKKGSSRYGRSVHLAPLAYLFVSLNFLKTSVADFLYPALTLCDS